MKKNMSFKIIATVGLWAAIGLTACKAPQLSPDGERAVQAKHGTGDNEPGQPATGKRLAIT